MRLVLILVSALLMGGCNSVNRMLWGPDQHSVKEGLSPEEYHHILCENWPSLDECK